MKGSSQINSAYIGLGSNLGDREDYLRKGIKLLDKDDRVGVEGVSTFIETKALGSTDAPKYLNAAVKISTGKSPQELFELLQSIENDLGRERKERWSPRTIDLDLLLYGDEVIKTEKLIVPHEQMHLRSFVLKCVCELDREILHPVLKQPVRVLAERLGGRDHMFEPNCPQLISIAGIIGVGKTTLAEGLSETLKCKLIRESYDTNPYMAEVYAGKQEMALDSQLYFHNSRVAQLKKSELAAGTAVVSDYLFDKELIYARETLTAEQLSVYDKYNREAGIEVAKPVLVIYFHDSPEACLERIHNRNRPYEQSIDVSMLKRLYDGYEELFTEWCKSPVMRISAGEFNCMNKESVVGLTEEVESYIWKP